MDIKKKFKFFNLNNTKKNVKKVSHVRRNKITQNDRKGVQNYRE